MSFLKKINFPLVLPAFFLTCFGLLSIYSSSLWRNDFSQFQKQIVFFLLSVLAFFLLSLFDLRFLKANSKLVFFFYLISLLSLFFLLFFAPQIRGVKGWYRIGSFSIDPVPLSAIILIIVLSKFFSKRHVHLRRFRLIVFSGVYALLPVLLVLFQPDLGSALTLIAVWLGILIFSGIRLKHFFALCLIFLIIFCVGWKFWLKDYQKQRIFSFFNPELDPKGISWSVNQSKIAIGSGGLFGKGIGKGSQTQYGFLSEPKTDFIFSAISEEFGFFGAFLLLTLFFWLFYSLVRIVFSVQNNFVRLFSAGFAFLILSQAFLNIGMCLGLVPVVGLPLPFVSYGGGHLFGFWVGLGILNSLRREH